MSFFIKKMNKPRSISLFGRFMCLLLAVLVLSGYGYGTEDPLIVGFKNIGKKLAKNDWESIPEEVKKLDGQIKHAQTFENLNLDQEFDKAIQGKDRATLATTWIRLTIATVRTHLWWNLHENLKDRSKAKPRIDAIDRFLKDILGSPIKSKNFELFKSISESIGNLRECIGSPGAFGLGATPTDAPRFIKEVTLLEKNLWEAYPESAPAWTKSTQSDSLKNIFNSISSEKSFYQRKSKLDQARHHLYQKNYKKFESLLLNAYRQMGAPGDSHADQKSVDSNFNKTIQKLIEVTK